MKAVVMLGQKALEVMEWPDPSPGPGEVVVEIKASGMCGSDLHHYREQSLRNTLVVEGHEPAGVVVEIGSGVDEREASIGDRVMVHHYDGCRTCGQCRTGWTQLCDSKSKVIYGLHEDGSHAPYMRAPAHTLVKLPEELSFKTGAAISCGTGTAYGALRRVNLRGEEIVAVFGQGPVGLSATQLAKAMGARVIAIDVEDERLKMAAELGADHVINPAENDAVEAILELTSGEGAHKAIECSSNSLARQQSIMCVRRWGSTALVGVYGEPLTIDTSEIIFKPRTISGSITFSKNWQSDCAEFIADRRISVDSIFSHEFSIEDAKRAYSLFDERKITKGVFLM